MSAMLHSPSVEDTLRLPQLHFEQLDDLPDIALPQAHQWLSPRLLAIALSRGCNPTTVIQYVQQFPREHVRRALEYQVEGHRVITYAVDRENVEIIQSFLEYDFDVDCRDFGIPLIAFALLRTAKSRISKLEVIKLLLAHGADPLVIPKELWSSSLEERRNALDSLDARLLPIPQKWCVAKYRHAIDKAMNLTATYYFWRASSHKKYTKRMMQIARAHKMTALLQLPFLMAGQELGSNLVLETVYGHIALNTTKPLVMAFAGSQGTGLANHMGSLLSLPATALDCTYLNSQTALFGPTYGHQGNTSGGPLNNFLVENQGTRCVVCLNEFHNANADVWDSLLGVMDNGTYYDRREGFGQRGVDCRRVIWILSGSFGDNLTYRFYDDHLAQRNPRRIYDISIKPLQDELSELFRARFSAAVTGRINTIVPFFPYPRIADDLLAHRSVLEELDRAQRPVN
ncbi:hypothetical protein F5Y05DRAFT_419429 [Hypoxylon sp. FL0543]|nr:hypothetical protein F5Y05DRAFT_419429 [Hypoxylon sp. FL0543]